jgi:hypothetical protein
MHLVDLTVKCAILPELHLAVYLPARGPVRATLSSVRGAETSRGIQRINIGTRIQERKYYASSRGIRREERMRIPTLGENLYTNW